MAGRYTTAIGLVIFTLSSMACALAQTDTQLIGFRAVQGVGGALLNPLSLSILVAAFPRKQGRARLQALKFRSEWAWSIPEPDLVLALDACRQSALPTRRHLRRGGSG